MKETKSAGNVCPLANDCESCGAFSSSPHKNRGKARQSALVQNRNISHHRYLTFVGAAHSPFVLANTSTPSSRRDFCAPTRPAHCTFAFRPLSTSFNLYKGLQSGGVLPFPGTRWHHVLLAPAALTRTRRWRKPLSPSDSLL